MPDTPSFAEQQLERIESLLAKNPGVRSVTVDGVAVAFDDLIKQRMYWRAEVQRESGQNRRIIPINLGGF